ncbi:MAG: adenine phosphoribosyltransferase [Clostridia bacterium]|nr:adenine phosphoribosyltransferase [Clostridia bacterium]
MAKKLEEYVVTIPDFPEPGIQFRDITSVIQDPEGLKLAVDGLVNLVRDIDFDLVVGPESRGFIFGVPVAYLLGKGFIPVRKKGKLPRKTVSQKYDLEYGQAEVEIHEDAIRPGQKVIIVDDLMATGGSAEAAARLVEKLGGQVVRMAFVMELAGLQGRKRLQKYLPESLIIYPGK